MEPVRIVLYVTTILAGLCYVTLLILYFWGERGREFLDDLKAHPKDYIWWIIVVFGVVPLFLFVGPVSGLFSDQKALKLFEALFLIIIQVIFLVVGALFIEADIRKRLAEKRMTGWPQILTQKGKSCQSCGADLINPLDFFGSKEAVMISLRGPRPGLDALSGKSAKGSAGFVCKSCKATFCMPCMLEKGRPRADDEGMGCLKCGGRMDMLS